LKYFQLAYFCPFLLKAVFVYLQVARRREGTEKNTKIPVKTNQFQEKLLKKLF
jgi:hypothetical protein